MENVSTNHIAPLWFRFAGKSIDVGVTLCFLVAVNFPIYMVASKGVSDRIANLSIFIVILYICFADGFNGQSIGKRVRRIAVIEKKSGERCSLPKSFVRNFLLGFFILDWIFLLGKDRQRLGDIGAGTIVVQLPSKKLSANAS